MNPDSEESSTLNQEIDHLFTQLIGNDSAIAGHPKKHVFEKELKRLRESCRKLPNKSPFKLMMYGKLQTIHGLIETINEAEPIEQLAELVPNTDINRLKLSAEELKLLNERGEDERDETILRLDLENCLSPRTPFESACLKWKAIRLEEIKESNRPMPREAPDKPDRGWW